jgi:hypothetical protein
VIVKVAIDCPAATVTVAGGTPAELLEAMLTTYPPAGASPLIVTVPWVDVPPVTVAGLIWRSVTVGAVTATEPVCVTPLALAVIVVDVFVWTGVVETGNVIVDTPAGTVTDVATVPAAVLLEDSATTNPPEGALPERVTVPVEAVPPTTDVGLNETPVKTGAVIVRVAVGEVPFPVAVIVDVVFDATPTVVTVNVPVVAPAATLTDDGTVAAALLELRATATPPEGAALLSVTVPVEVFPPATDVGFKVTDVTVGALTLNVAVTLAVVLACGVDAVIVSTTLVVIPLVVIVNVPVFEPAATEIDAGTVADESLDESVTVTEPPVATVPLSVTVPVDVPPPRTDVGLSVKEEIQGT